MIPAALTVLMLLVPPGQAKSELSKPPAASKLLILLMGEPEFDFDLVVGDGVADPGSPYRQRQKAEVDERYRGLD